MTRFGAEKIDLLDRAQRAARHEFGHTEIMAAIAQLLPDAELDVFFGGERRQLRRLIEIIGERLGDERRQASFQRRFGLRKVRFRRRVDHDDVCRRAFAGAFASR